MTDTGLAQRHRARSEIGIQAPSLQDSSLQVPPPHPILSSTWMSQAIRCFWMIMMKKLMVLQQPAACLVFSKQFCVHPTDVFLPFQGTESLNT